MEDAELISEMDIVVRPGRSGHHVLMIGALTMRCAIGRAGVGADKREGDGATPIGTYPLRQVLYRADRMAEPETALPVRALAKDDSWCEAPGDPHYNRLIKRVLGDGYDMLWREDHLYDVIIVIGYNDAPVLSGKGSAIFLHLARENYGATSGCVAVTREDIFKILKLASPQTRITILPAS